MRVYTIAMVTHKLGHYTIKPLPRSSFEAFSYKRTVSKKDPIDPYTCLYDWLNAESISPYCYIECFCVTTLSVEPLRRVLFPATFMCTIGGESVRQDWRTFHKIYGGYYIEWEIKDWCQLDLSFPDCIIFINEKYKGGL